MKWYRYTFSLNPQWIQMISSSARNHLWQFLHMYHLSICVPFFQFFYCLFSHKVNGYSVSFFTVRIANEFTNFFMSATGIPVPLDKNEFLEYTFLAHTFDFKFYHSSTAFPNTTPKHIHITATAAPKRKLSMFHLPFVQFFFHRIHFLLMHVIRNLKFIPVI